MATRETLEHYLSLNYPARFIADPDGGYVVLFPDLPGCITQGDTWAEAADMAEDARLGWLASQYELGKEIPLPSVAEEHSGKFNVRLPRSLHRSLATGAEEEGVSLNQYVSTLLARRDAQERVERRLDEVERELHGIHAQLQQYHIAQVPEIPRQLIARRRRGEPSEGYFELAAA